MSTYTFVLELPTIALNWQEIFSGLEAAGAYIFFLLLVSYMCALVLHKSRTFEIRAVALFGSIPYFLIVGKTFEVLNHRLVGQDLYDEYREKAVQLDELYDVGGSDD